MTTVNINNKGYVGNSITIINGKVIINGKDVTPDAKEINIQVAGNIETLEVDYCNKLSIIGDVKDVKTSSGNVDISGGVSGSVQTSSGDIELEGSVGGNIQTSSGDVKCGAVSGKVSTMSGDIKHK